MLRYITLDDNKVHLNELNACLNQIPLIHCIGSFCNPIEAFSFLKETKVDIVFMDIEMPEMSGIELAQQLSDPPLFVFISSHPDFGAQTYEVDALDYLMKPVRVERLLKTMKRVYRIIDEKKTASGEIKIDQKDAQHFFIKDQQQFIRINFEDLLYAESLNSFVHLYLSNGKKHLILVGLKSLTEQLPASHFLRISRSILVNRQKITAFSPSHVSLGSLEFGVGQTYTQQLLKELNPHLISRFGEKE